MVFHFGPSRRSKHHAKIFCHVFTFLFHYHHFVFGMRVKKIYPESRRYATPFTLRNYFISSISQNIKYPTYYAIALCHFHHKINQALETKIISCSTSIHHFRGIQLNFTGWFDNLISTWKKIMNRLSSVAIPYLISRKMNKNNKWFNFHCLMKPYNHPISSSLWSQNL